MPLFLGRSTDHFGATGLGDVSVLGVVLRVFAITIVPVAIGMELRRRRPARVAAVYPTVRRVLLGLFGIVVLGDRQRVRHGRQEHRRGRRCLRSPSTSPR